MYAIRMYLLDFGRVPSTNYMSQNDLNCLIVTMNIAVQRCDSFPFFRELPEQEKVRFRSAYKTRSFGFLQKSATNPNKGSRIQVGPDLALIFYRLLFETWQAISRSTVQQTQSVDGSQNSHHVNAAGTFVPSRIVVNPVLGEDFADDDSTYNVPVSYSSEYDASTIESFEPEAVSRCFPELLIRNSSYATSMKYYPSAKSAVSNTVLVDFCSSCLSNAVFVAGAFGMKNCYQDSLGCELDITEPGQMTKFVKFAAHTISKNLHMNFNCKQFPEYITNTGRHGYGHCHCPVTYGFDIAHEVIPLKKNSSFVVNGFLAKAYVEKACKFHTNEARANEEMWQPTGRSIMWKQPACFATRSSLKASPMFFYQRIRFVLFFLTKNYVWMGIVG